MAKKTDNKKTGTDQAVQARPVSKKRRSTSWKAGQSGNPKGRPKSGEALSEVLREAVSAKALLDRMKWLADNAESETVRYHALSWLAERGWGKAPLEVVVRKPNPYARKVKGLTVEQLEVLAVIDETFEEPEPDAEPKSELN